MLTDKAARNAAYRAGYCVDCGAKPYSPARTRCDECFAAHVRRRAA